MSASSRKATFSQTASTSTGKGAPKMTTDIPSEITTPDSVETRLGTLKFFDGLPDKATVEKVYDNLDFQRGVLRRRSASQHPPVRSRPTPVRR
jgi:hypothetical protein